MPTRKHAYLRVEQARTPGDYRYMVVLYTHLANVHRVILSETPTPYPTAVRVAGTLSRLLGDLPIEGVRRKY